MESLHHQALVLCWVVINSRFLEKKCHDTQELLSDKTPLAIIKGDCDAASS
jgi:hypothetical protein